MSPVDVRRRVYSPLYRNSNVSSRIPSSLISHDKFLITNRCGKLVIAAIDEKGTSITPFYRFYGDFFKKMLQQKQCHIKMTNLSRIDRSKIVSMVKRTPAVKTIKEN